MRSVFLRETRGKNLVAGETVRVLVVTKKTLPPFVLLTVRIRSTSRMAMLLSNSKMNPNK